MAGSYNIWYDTTSVWQSIGVPEWANENYRQITLAEPATGDFLTWLEANAVRLPLTGTWVFNKTPSLPSSEINSGEISSSTDISVLNPDYTGTGPLLLTGISISGDNISFETYLDGTQNLYAAYSNGAWEDSSMRTITFTKPVQYKGNEEFIKWFTANAVKLVPISGTWVFNKELTKFPHYEEYSENPIWIEKNIKFSEISHPHDPIYEGFSFGFNDAGETNEFCYGDMLTYDYLDKAWLHGIERAIVFDTPQIITDINFYDWFFENARPFLAKGKTLNEYTWGEISQISLADKATEYGFKAGDAKEVTLKGSVGYGSTARTFSNQKYWVYIIGINHNEAKEGKGIAFQGFKTAQNGGVNIAVTGTNYGSTSNSSGMIMNTTSTNSGGWNGSWAYTTCMGQWKSCFPSDLQAAIKSTTLYTDNTGNGSTSASAVTSNNNGVYYLAEYEVFGSNSNANKNESAQQAQYDYYKAGNSKIKYRSDNTGTAARWWLRSLGRSTGNSFCTVSANGVADSSYYANYSYAAAPCFKV